MWLSHHGRWGRKASVDDVELLFLRKQKRICQLLLPRLDWNDGKGIYGYNTICWWEHMVSVVWWLSCSPNMQKGPGSESSGNRFTWGSFMAQLVKNPPAIQKTWVRSLGWENPLERGTATHSSILAWRIPWTVSSKGSQRVRHDWATFTFTEKSNWCLWSLLCIGIGSETLPMVPHMLFH